MRKYEIMLIMDPSQDARTAAPALERYLDVVRKEKGSVDKVDVWGKQRLAYPIEKKEEGVYVVIDVECEPDTVKEFDRLLNLNDSILRTKVLRTDK